MASSEQNKAMAKRMKEDGVRRTVARCPVCNQVVAVRALANHIAFHK